MSSESRSNALPKRLFRTGFLLAVVVAALTGRTTLWGEFGSSVQYFPQVVLNGGSSSSFTIHNPNDATITVDVQVYSPTGDSLNSRQVELGPRETETISFGDPGAELMRGWAELKSDHRFIAGEFFQLFVGELQPRVGVLPSPATDEIRFLGFVNDEFKTGMAVHNPSPTRETELTVRVRNHSGGEPVAEKTLTLGPRQSEAAFLNDSRLFGPALEDFEGVVEVSVGSSPVAVLSLVQETGGGVATIAVETQNFVFAGDTNTSLGRGSLAANTTGFANTATGSYALASNTEGMNNTGIGYEALAANTTGSSNTAIGFVALIDNTTGMYNTATGFSALGLNTTGSENTAMGYLALANNTTSYSNTAVGYSALVTNDEGFDNTAIGHNALRSNLSGFRNAAIGFSALASNTTGSENMASGSSALVNNTTGNDNTASGVFALARNTSGFNNTAMGCEALGSSTIGYGNIALGVRAGFDNVEGNNNIYIGNQGMEESDVIRIGDGAHTSAYIAGTQLVQPSSRRFKRDIQEMGPASLGLMRLRPVTFRYKPEFDSGDTRLQYGLIAEEVAEVYPELVVFDKTGQAKTVEYQKLSAMLLNELQRQQNVIADLMERLSRMERSLSRLENAAPAN